MGRRRRWRQMKGCEAASPWRRRLRKKARPPHDGGVMEEGGRGRGEEVTRRRMKTNKGSQGRMTTCGPVASPPPHTHAHTHVTASHLSVRGRERSSVFAAL